MSDIKDKTKVDIQNIDEEETAHTADLQTCPVQIFTKVNEIHVTADPFNNCKQFTNNECVKGDNPVTNPDQFIDQTEPIVNKAVVVCSRNEDNSLDEYCGPRVFSNSHTNDVLESQGNFFSRQDSHRRSQYINEFLESRRKKKEQIERKLSKSEKRGSDMSSKILKEYYDEFCKDGQTQSSDGRKCDESDRNQNNDNETNLLATSSDSIGEATVLDSDDVSDFEAERSRTYRSKVKRRTSSTIRKIQEMIQEEQMKDMRGKNFSFDGNSSKYPVNAGLPYKSNVRQRSKSRSKFVKVINDQAHRPFRRWLGVSTCVASDTRFIVQPGKEADVKLRDDVTLDNKAYDISKEHSQHESESDDDEILIPKSSHFDNTNQENEYRIKGSIVFGKEKTVHQSKGYSQQVKSKDGRQTDVISEPVIKIINVGEPDAEKSKCPDTGCECTSKQIVNVEGNDGVIHIHQQSHGTVGKMTTKGGSSNRGVHSSCLEDEVKSSTFKSLKKKLKKAKKRQYVTVQAIKDWNGVLPGQLSFKKGQLIKQLKTGQTCMDGMCYGYYKSGRLHRKMWGIYPASHVTLTNSDPKPRVEDISESYEEEAPEMKSEG